MDIHTIGEHVYIVLSRRNITQLLSALDKGYAEGIVRRCEDGTSLHVRVEENEDHYTGREAGPGLGEV